MTYLENQTTYCVYCINAFANKYDISPKQAFNYLYRFGGIDFLVECYDAEHQLSLEDAIGDLTIVCRRNGGALE